MISNYNYCNTFKTLQLLWLLVTGNKVMWQFRMKFKWWSSQVLLLPCFNTVFKVQILCILSIWLMPRLLKRPLNCHWNIALLPLYRWIDVHTPLNLPLVWVTLHNLTVSLPIWQDISRELSAKMSTGFLVEPYVISCARYANTIWLFKFAELSLGYR